MLDGRSAQVFPKEDMQMNIDDQIKLAIVNGLFTLGGVLIGILLPSLKELLLIKSNRKTEVLKIHDLDRIKAYKELIHFNNLIINTTFPLAEDKLRPFLQIMENDYPKFIEMNIPYYTKEIIDLLENFQSTYICIISPDLSGEVDTKSYIEKDLFSDAQKIDKELKKVIKTWS